MRRPLNVLLLYASDPENETFSYQRAWPRHFQAHPRFRCTAVNLAALEPSARLYAHLVARTARIDAIVLLHSVFSNACFLQGRLFEAVRRRPQPKAFLIGNEYKAMPEKMAFCEQLGISLLISQTLSPAVHALYRERLGCAIGGVPNTGLDCALFQPRAPLATRSIDIGYRAADAGLYLGHNERRELADYFTAHAGRLGLTVDISLEAEDRFAEADWAAFLNRCKGQLGAEAGGDYFELTDRTRIEVNTYVMAHPEATPDDVFERFFKDRARLPLRLLSGRNIEAAGTGTVQILFEGDYDGYFHPDEHYIPLKKDFSNVDEAIDKFRDEAYCARVTTNARDLAMQQLTYPKLIDHVHDLLEPLA